MTVEEENQIKAPIIKRFEEEGHPYFSSARYLYNALVLFALLKRAGAYIIISLLLFYYEIQAEYYGTQANKYICKILKQNEIVKSKLFHVTTYIFTSEAE